FVEKSNLYVKFHAAQSILIYSSYFILTVFGVVAIFGGAFLSILTSTSNAWALDTSFSLVFLLLQCGVGLMALAHLGFQIWGTVAGFTGTFVSMPLIGPIAERWAGGRPIPAY